MLMGLVMDFLVVLVASLLEEIVHKLQEDQEQHLKETMEAILIMVRLLTVLVEAVVQVQLETMEYLLLVEMVVQV